MKKHIKKDILEIRLCTSCFHCKTKNKKIYCKLGVWREEEDDYKTILHTPYDFDCPEWDG